MPRIYPINPESKKSSCETRERLPGSLAAKKYTPVSAGTLPTHGLLFVVMLVGVVILVGALTFVPALALGPIAEHLMMVE